MMRKQKLEHLLTTGMIEGKLNRGKQRKNILDGLTKWLNLGRVTEALKVTRDRDAWKGMITYAKELDT